MLVSALMIWRIAYMVKRNFKACILSFYFISISPNSNATHSRILSPWLGYEHRNRFRQPMVSWRAGMTKRVVVQARQAGNRFLGSLKGLQLRDRLYIVGLGLRCSMRFADSACNLLVSYGVIVWLCVSIIFVGQLFLWSLFILPGGNTSILITSEKDLVLASFLSCTLIKKKRNFSSKIRKFRVEQLQSHIRGRAS